MELRGRLLIAMPMLRDPNFARTVVLLLAHEQAGALGLVLNRPSELEVAEALPDRAPRASMPPVVFVGGPVSPDAAICLSDASPEPVIGGVGVLDLSQDETPGRIRLYAGYSGWDEGQLEAEIAAGAWAVVDAHPDDPFTAHPDALWRVVLRRQRGELATLANFPLDPAMN